jgi:hypothetical protein
MISAGNIIVDKNSYTYTYDYENRLIQISKREELKDCGTFNS